ncbi:MAG: hypothetical protein HY645_02925 [Acidobacteria bacterium]|nr:hypothetical protein [Acidobacteriota bacterium]
MDLQQLNLKFFVEDPSGVDLALLPVIFNRWIKEKVAEELLIDVADYRHVFHGPGVVLIGHECNFSMDCGGGRLGLLYNRKSKMSGNDEERLQKVFKATLTACRRLELDPLWKDGLTFQGDEFQLIINDRLLAPNTDETLQKLQPTLLPFLARFYKGANLVVNRDENEKQRFSMAVRSDTTFSVEELLANLS